MNPNWVRWKKGSNQAKKGWRFDSTADYALFPTLDRIAFDAMDGFVREGIKGGSQGILGNEFKDGEVGMGEDGKTVMDNGLFMGCIVHRSYIMNLRAVLL